MKESLGIKENGLYIHVSYNAERFTIGEMEGFEEYTDLTDWYDDVTVTENEVSFRIRGDLNKVKQIYSFVRLYNDKVREKINQAIERHTIKQSSIGEHAKISKMNFNELETHLKTKGVLWRG